MNIVSTMVGLSIAGASAPMLMDMSLAPIIAQKRALNFGEAESLAVSYSAANEGQLQLIGSVPEGCERTEIASRAYEIECTKGENQFVQSVTRSFRLYIPPSSCDNDGNNGHGNSGGHDCSNPGKGNKERTFAYPKNPYGFTHNECRGYEDWGGQTAAFNRQTWQWVSASCEPTPARALAWYNASHPDEWRIDINAYSSLPPHKHY